MKQSITHAEFLQLKGLRAMAMQYNETLVAISRAARQIVGHPSQDRYDGGHIDDLIYSSGDRETVETTLQKMGIAVDPPPPEPPPRHAEYCFLEEERLAALAVVQAARANGWPEAEKLADLEKLLSEQKPQ